VLTARLELDVTHALSPAITGGRALRIHARVFAEPNAVPRERAPAVLACLSGGSCDWRNWQCEIPGHSGYSMAEEPASNHLP
jgi:hypothetical protein